MLQNKKHPSLFQGGHFLPTTPYQVEISFKFHIKYFFFVCFGHEDPLSLQLLRILESNNANIPHAQLSYNMDFKARQGKIGKNILPVLHM